MLPVAATTHAGSLFSASDEALIAEIASEREGALAEAYRRHSGPVFRMARNLTRNETLAEEVVQEVFLRLWRHPDKFDASRGSLRSFLLAHAHGRSIDLIRSEASRRNREERDGRLAAQIRPGLDEDVWQLALAADLRAALASLPDGERRALELAYFGGLTYREVATQLALPEGTVKSRIRAGLRRLRDQLSEAGLAA